MSLLAAVYPVYRRADELEQFARPHLVYAVLHNHTVGTVQKTLRFELSFVHRLISAHKERTV